MREKRFLVYLSTVTLFLWLTDFPAIFGRCPSAGANATLQFAPYDSVGLIFGLTSGLITFLSPCGLPPLPAYIRYFLGAKSSMERSISLSFLSTSGFVFAIGAMASVFLLFRRSFTRINFSPITIFGSLGGANFVISADFFDLLGLAAGIIAIVMGIIMLLRIRIRIPFFKVPSLGIVGKDVRSVFLFSVGWGVAAIACAPFALIPLLFYSLTSGSSWPFVGYAFGMALPVLTLSLMLGAGKGPLVQRLVTASSRIHRYSGILLVLMGIYVVFYTFINPAVSGSYVLPRVG